MKRLSVGISEEAHQILSDYQKDKRIATRDDALDAALKELKKLKEKKAKA